MKRRILMMAAMVLMALTATAQGMRALHRQMMDVSVVKAEEAKAMRPDTVMPNGEWQKVVQTEMTAKEGFKYARQVLANIVPDYQRNVQLEDTTDCKLVVTVALPLMARAKNGYWYRGQYNLTMTMTMKDNRYRVSGNEVKCETGIDVRVPGVDTSLGLDFSLVSKDTEGAMQRDLQWKVGQMVGLIDSRLKKQKSDDDF